MIFPANSEFSWPLYSARDQWELVTWLKALATGKRPDGKSGELVRVTEGAIVTVDYGGKDATARGMYSAVARYLGVIPAPVAQYSSCDPTTEVSYRVAAPSVVYATTGGTAYVCVTDEQLAAAQKTTALRQWLYRRWNAAAEHGRQYHSKGCCWAGQQAGELHASFDTGLEAEFLTRGRPDLDDYVRVHPDRLAKRYTPDVREDLEQIIPDEPVPAAQAARHEALYFRFRAEYEEELKPGQREFARQQYEKLVAMGFSQKRASSIMQAAGPGRAVAAAEWAQQALAKVGGSVDALDMVLSGLGGANQFGRGRTEAALQALGLEPPKAGSSGALFALLKGAHTAVLAGLPEREPAATNSRPFSQENGRD